MLVLRTSELGRRGERERMPLSYRDTDLAQTRLRSYSRCPGYTATPVAEPVTFVYCILFVSFDSILSL